MGNLIHFILHLDTYIELFISNYGILTYLILFFIIFIETGLVITPFLPGDSLIFAAAAFCAKGELNIFLLAIILYLAAILGDTANYFIGKGIGHKLTNSRFIKKKHLKATEDFYAKYGGKAVIIGRFVPIVRTFVPFVAGIGIMKYRKFISFNVIGGVLWVTIISCIGFFFGNIPFVKDHFSLVTIAIILISVMPAIVTLINERRKSAKLKK